VFKPDGNESLPIGEPPVLAETGAGGANGIGLNIDHSIVPTTGAQSILYRGQLRQCIPLGASYRGISYNGQGCFTIGKVALSARVTADHKVQYNFATPEQVGVGRLDGALLWTKKLL